MVPHKRGCQTGLTIPCGGMCLGLDVGTPPAERSHVQSLNPPTVGSRVRIWIPT